MHDCSPKLILIDNSALVEVNLSHNKLETLPRSLGDLEAEELRINASSNRLLTIPNSFYKLFGTGEGRGSRRAITEPKINLQDNPELDIIYMLNTQGTNEIKETLQHRCGRGTREWYCNGHR